MAAAAVAEIGFPSCLCPLWVISDMPSRRSCPLTPQSGHGELASICPLSAITGLDWYDCCYEAAGGVQSFGASSKPLKSNPGATVQLNSVHSPRLCAACQAC